WERRLEPGELEELEVRAGAAVAVAHHDVLGDGLEARAEMLARLDQHVALASRIDAAMREYAEIKRLGALFRHHDLHPAGVEHGGAAHAHRRAGRHRPGDHEPALRAGPYLS